jgi:putative oxidoreductase
MAPARGRPEVGMSALAKLDRPVSLALRLSGVVLLVAPVLTRLAVGFAFYETGKGKIENFERTVGFFSGIGIPFPEANAAFVSRLEYYGGMLLIAGLLTRVASALLSSTLIVALLTAHRAEVLALLTRADDAPAVFDIAPLPFLIGLVWLIGFGPGPLSLDHLLFRRLGKSPPRAA